jgi:hypothetical protein
MLSRLALLGFTLLCCATLDAQSAVPEPYTEAEAYNVYDVLLPQQSSAETLVIRQETSGFLSQDAQPFDRPENCVGQAAASEFQDAIQDYDRVNQKRWLLQRKFAIDRPYELLDSGTLKTLFRDSEGWDRVYARFPNSEGIYDMSAVGLNHDKTKAVVYFGSSCHWLCGEWSFHLLRKINGKWEEASGFSTCTTVS